jgi:hypothetical protein
VFDSEIAKMQNGWTDEDEALVVQTLRGGQHGAMYVEVVPVAAEKPWNGYDELDKAERVVELALAIGADLEKVAQYEAENQNRPGVIAALQDAIEEAGETIVVSA